MKYLITCLIVAVLAGCDQASNTIGKPDATATPDDETGTQAQMSADAVMDPSGSVFEYGIYNTLRKGRVRDEITTNTGKVINKPVLELAEQTDRIPL